jgi:hypothetical protein
MCAHHCRKRAEITAMCGRVRLFSDDSEIEIAMKSDPGAPAPNFKAD